MNGHVRKNDFSVRQQRTILVTGGAGYIGCILVPRLLEAGYRVRVLDRLLYGDAGLHSVARHPDFEFINADFRDNAVVNQAVQGVDAVIHLGAIVGDAACDLDESVAISTNLHATRLLGEACRAHGVARLVFISTCSVYGASDDTLDETSSLNPVSLYARTKIAAEEQLLELQNVVFSPVILRLGTAFGYSPRPRFDLVVNLLTAQAMADGGVSIYGGSQWRPFVHIEDISRAIEHALEAPSDLVAGEIFNVGGNAHNHQLGELGQLIQEAIPGVAVSTLDHVVDRRNYYVRFDKIARVLGYEPVHSVRDGIWRLKQAIESGLVGHFRDIPYHNHLMLKAIPAGLQDVGAPLFRGTPVTGALVER